MALDTGQGATVSLSVSNFSACFTELDMAEQTIPAVNMSCLDTVGFEQYMPGDLIEPGTITIPFFVDPETVPPVIGVKDTITITAPASETGNTAGTWAGTGFLTAYKPNQFIKNEMQTGSLTWQWDGVTGPTYTPETQPA